MKAYLKFAAGFWMRAFLMMGTMPGAPSRSTNKNSRANAAPMALL
jgi:hypothetical protein